MDTARLAGIIVVAIVAAIIAYMVLKLVLSLFFSVVTLVFFAALLYVVFLIARSTFWRKPPAQQQR
jgi:hypothetical protein